MKGMSAFSQIKEDISNKVLLIALIVSVPGAILSGIRISNFGITPQFIVDISSFFALTFLFIFRNRIKFTARISILILWALLLGTTSLLNWGLFNLGTFILFFSIILALVFFGLRWGTIIYIVTLLIHIAFALLIHFKKLDFRWDFNVESYSTFSWILRIVFFSIFSLIAIVSLGLVYKKLQELNQELTISEERYRLAMNSVNEVVFDVDLIAQEYSMSENYFDFFNTDPKDAESVITEWFDRIHPEDKEKVMGQIDLCNANKTDLLYIEYRLQDKKGRWHWILTKGKVIERTDKGSIERMVGTHTDIGHRKEMERILAESEQRFRMLFVNAHDTILLLSDDTIIECNNQGFEFFGLPHDKIVGSSLTKFFYHDPILSTNSISAYEMLKSEVIPGKTVVGEQKFLTSAGMVRDTILSISAIEEHDSKMYQVMLHDITDRKQYEQFKLNTIIEVEERERYKLAGDLHDDVGPMLSSLNMYLSLLSRQQNSNKQEIVENMQQVLKETIAGIRSILHNLSPHVLFKHGIVAAIQTVVDQNNKMLNIRFTHDVTHQNIEEATAIMVLRIVKELTNNTLKYANAKNIGIDLTIYSNLLSLSYTDDGVGFDIESKLQGPGGGIGLINIQERLKTMGAIYSMVSGIGNGFTFSMRVPIKFKRDENQNSDSR